MQKNVFRSFLFLISFFMTNERSNHEEVLLSSDTQPLTEQTGQQILLALDNLFLRLDAGRAVNQDSDVEPTPTLQRQSTQGPSRCEKPRTTDEFGNRLIRDPNLTDIDTALRDYFHVSESSIIPLRNDLTKHLCGVIRTYIVERMQHCHQTQPRAVKWKNIPDRLLISAIQKFEDQAQRVLNLNLSACEGSWIARHCLRVGWNNFVAPERSRREQVQEDVERSSRFRLTTSSPSLSPAPSPRLVSLA